MKIKTASDLKYMYQEKNPNGHFFDRDTLKFFGDTMANYGIKNHPKHKLIELVRKRPVKHGLWDSAYFDAVTFKEIRGLTLALRFEEILNEA